MSAATRLIPLSIALLGCPTPDGGGEASGSATSSDDDGPTSDDAPTSDGGPDGGDGSGPATSGDDGSDGEPDGDSGDDGPNLDPPTPGADVMVPLWSGAHLYWAGDGDDHRRASVDVELPPADQGYESVQLSLALTCPEGGCDRHDRYGTLAVVDGDRQIEVARFATPFGVPASLSFDVSHLRPLLTGSRTLELHIDTWVGPGDADGAGWLVDAELSMIGGVPSPRPIAVLPVHTRRAFELGNPSLPVEDEMPPVTVSLPEGTTSARLVTLSTQYGVGNTENCGEHCQLAHGYLVGGSLILQSTVWRNDCDRTPVPGQLGNWAEPRAGWCPGSEVRPTIEDLGEMGASGEPLDFAFAVSSYDNTCYPDADPCDACFGVATCEYNAVHTQALARVSSLVVAYVD